MSLIIIFIILAIVLYIVFNSYVPIFTLLLPSAVIYYIGDLIEKKYFKDADKKSIMILDIVTYLLAGIFISILTKMFMPSSDFSIVFFVLIMIILDIIC